MIHRTRLTSAACLVTFLVTGCGTATTQNAHSVLTGKQTVTFYVKEMSYRLKLD
jgi:hypothetical protein